MRNFALIILALLLAAPLASTAQKDGTTYISGTVTDSETGESLPGVNVYLSGTTAGTSTGSDGSYEFSTPYKGSYELVFSMIGYGKKVVTVELLPSPDRVDLKKVDAELRPRDYELGELEVRASNKEWKRNYKRFETEFIGTTRYAEETTVENPWVMEFSEGERGGYLVASSAEPLHIVNEALGYHVYVEIDEFQWTTTGTAGYYRAYPRYEEMEAESDRQRREWENNREEAYRGSRRHFFRSLYHGRLNTDMFTVTSRQDIVPMSEGQVRFELMGRAGVSRELMSVVKGYRLLRQIRVEHGRINKYETSKFGGGGFNITTSIVTPNRRNGSFFIDELGNLLNPTSLGLEGDWASHRMANTLPMDYLPQ